MKKTETQNLKFKALILEEDLMILCARLELNDEDSYKIEYILKQELDWDRIINDSKRLGIQPLLYKHLYEEKYICHVPDNIMSLLENNFRLQSIRSLKIYAQINQILDIMNSHNISVILLKGIFMAKWIYKDIALRPMSDIDILCKKEDVRIIKNLMTQIGYDQRIYYHTDLHENVFGPTAKHLPEFLHPTGYSVEVHLHIFPKISYNFDLMQKIWKVAILSELNDKRVYHLSPEDQVLHLFLHLYEHLIISDTNIDIPLYWFCDIHEFIKQNINRIDWDRFLALLDSTGFGPQISSLFNLIVDNWHTPVHDSVLEFLNESRDQLSMTDVFQRKTNFKEYYSKIIKKGGELKGLKERLYFMIGLFFPTRDYLISRYGLSNSYLIWFYYIIHPYKMLMRAINRLVN
ncbi:Nucleotidyltransferase family protein [Candidatus Magnetomoraceae bacterium gMMP-15]